MVTCIADYVHPVGVFLRVFLLLQFFVAKHASWIRLMCLYSRLQLSSQSQHAVADVLTGVCANNLEARKPPPSYEMSYRNNGTGDPSGDFF